GGTMLTLGLVANDVVLAILGHMGRLARWASATRHRSAGEVPPRSKPLIAKRPRRQAIPAVLQTEFSTADLEVQAPVAAMAVAAAPSGDIPIRYPSLMETPELDGEANTAIAVEPVPVVRVTGPDELPDARFADFEMPPLTLLDDPEPFPYEEQD